MPTKELIERLVMCAVVIQEATVTIQRLAEANEYQARIIENLGDLMDGD
jgi:rRNA processing protein Krr1/Pno1